MSDEKSTINELKEEERIEIEEFQRSVGHVSSRTVPRAAQRRRIRHRD